MELLHHLADIQARIAHSEYCLMFIKTANCGVCDSVYNKILQLLPRYPSLNSFLVSIDNTTDIAGSYLVFSAPTLILFAEGKEVYRESRFIVLQRWIDLLDRYAAPIP